MPNAGTGRQNAATNAQTSCINNCPISMLGSHEMNSAEVFYVCQDPTMYSVSALYKWVFELGKGTYPHNRQPIPEADRQRLLRMHSRLREPPAPTSSSSESPSQSHVELAKRFYAMRPNQVSLNCHYQETWEGFWEYFDNIGVANRLSGTTQNMFVYNTRGLQSVMYSETIRYPDAARTEHERDIVVIVQSGQGRQPVAAEVYLVPFGVPVQQEMDAMIREMDVVQIANARNISPAIRLRPASAGGGGKITHNGRRYKVRHGPREGRYIVVNGKRIYCRQ